MKEHYPLFSSFFINRFFRDAGRVLYAFIVLVPFSFPLRAEKYLASIPPLYSILAGLLKDVAEADSLLNGQHSPHTYALKPSDQKRIRDSRMTVWIGLQYESFLQKPLQVFKKENLAVLNTPSLKLWPGRQGPEWQQDRNQNTCAHDHAHSDHEGYCRDPHIWLDPQNAITIAEYLKEYLILAHPGQASTIQKNFERLKIAFNQLDADLKSALLPLQERAYLVFHDGYQYFEKAFGLKGVGVFTYHPENSISARHFQHLVTIQKQQKISCVFYESQFRPAVIQEFSRRYKIPTGELDPFGLITFHDERDYMKMMKNLADSFVKCLKAS